MAGPTIHFYLDFLSPYAYLAHQRLPALAASVRHAIEYHPVDLAWIKREARNTGPTTREQPLKLAYARADMQRWARNYGVPLIPLKNYDSSRLNKGLLFAKDRAAAGDYVARAWRGVYGEGGDMSDDALLAAVAGELGWRADEFIAFTESGAADERLDESNRAAHRAGVFGVPTMIVGASLWWGNDRLDLMAQEIAPDPDRSRAS